ncbi:uncharacterized protein LOC125960230 isoform X1 [Anopheles darlingi]|uniref:uncharacterized protein LOC125960230 isoform X1 n=1 Tax=Anopheles darlingi TaxID=43151 RepID=UPI0021000F68|nr:uncharacterized protein LOC125960230 isoform X1 [Anopheles darlingi]
MFLVVETVNDNDEKEWKVAPKRWVCTTKNTRRTVLFWPHEISSERQKQLARAGSSKPMKNWSRKECIVQQECSTYDAANAAINGLLAQRSSSHTSIPISSELSSKKSNQISQQNRQTLQIANLIGSNSEESLPPSTVQSSPDEKKSIHASLKSMLESLIAKHEGVDTKIIQIENQNRHIIERNGLIEKDNFDMMEELVSIQKMYESVICQQLEATESLIENTLFSFDPLETIEQLIELDNKLKDESFRADMVTWLNLNVVGNKSKRRMASCLDLIFSWELQTNLLWSGTSRKGLKKHPVKHHKSILKLFKTIGATPLEKVSDRSIAVFFQKKLQYAKTRVFKHDEQPTSSNIQTIQTLEDHHQPDADDAINIVESSNPVDYIDAESLDDESDISFDVEILQ